MRGLVIAAGMAGLLTLPAGMASALASTQASASHVISNSSGYGGGWREGPFADESSCLAAGAAAEESSPYIIDASCDYLDDSPFTGTSDPGWYLWYFVENPNQ
jgi:hypothetical protein